MAFDSNQISVNTIGNITYNVTTYDGMTVVTYMAQIMQDEISRLIQKLWLNIRRREIKCLGVLRVCHRGIECLGVCYRRIRYIDYQIISRLSRNCDHIYTTLLIGTLNLITLMKIHLIDAFCIKVSKSFTKKVSLSWAVIGHWSRRLFRLRSSSQQRNIAMQLRCKHTLHRHCSKIFISLL